MKEEALEVIASTRTGILATLNEDGSPYATPVTYTFLEDHFTWQSSPDAVHSENIARDDRVSFSIVEFLPGKQRAVYINATAVAIGETIFNEQWQTSLTEYALEFGELDTKKSTPGRFYFRGKSE